MIKSTHHTAYYTQQRELCLLILILLGSADLILIILHPISKLGGIGDQFDITREGGYAEFFQYVKEFWCVVLLLLITRQTRHIGYLVWVFLFGYLLLDDMLEIHETGGGWLATHVSFEPGFGLRAKDLGELTVTFSVAVVLLLALGLTYWHSTDHFRKVSIDILILLVGLAFFGIVMDMLHVMFYSLEGIGDGAKILGEAAGWVEDGGEMLVMSLMVWYFFLMVDQRRPDFFLWQSLRIPLPEALYQLPSSSKVKTLK